MKNRIAFTTALALAAAFLPSSMHASVILFGTDFGAVNAIATGTSRAAAPQICDINNLASCGVGGVTGCTNSPENPTVLLGALGISGLLVGRKGRSLLQRKRMVTAAA